MRRFGLITALCVASASGLAAVALAAGVTGTVTKVPGVTSLQDVACARSGNCVAVGQIFGADPEGVVVVGRAVSRVPGTYDLLGVACPSANVCYAVGYGYLGAGRIVTITDGKPGPVRSFDSNPVAIGCGSTTSCWVTASWKAFTEARLVHVVNGNVTETLTFDHRHFVTPTQLSSVSPPACSSATSCILVGTTTYQHGSGLVFSLDDNKLRTIGEVRGTTALSGLACSSTVVCTIDGYGRRGVALLALKNGSLGAVRWVPGLDGLHYGVSPTTLACRSNDRCYLFGLEGSKSVIVPVDHGVPGSARRIGPFINRAFCSAASCVAAGRAAWSGPSRALLFSF